MLLEPTLSIDESARGFSDFDFAALINREVLDRAVFEESLYRDTIPINGSMFISLLRAASTRFTRPV